MNAIAHEGSAITPLRGVAQLAATIGTCVAGSLMFLLIPVLIEALRSAATVLSETQIGLIGSGDVAGMFVGAFLALFTAARYDRSILSALGLTVLCLANLLSLQSIEFWPLLSSRVLAGIGGGLAVGVAYSTFGASSQPDRNVALFLIVQTLIGSAVIGMLARLIPVHGVHAIFTVSLAVALIGLLCTALMPARATQAANSESTPRSPVAGSSTRLTGILCAASNFVFGSAFLAVWSNIESIGKALSLTSDGVAAALSLSLLSASAGSLLVATVGARWGRALPFNFLIGTCLYLRRHVQRR